MFFINEKEYELAKEWLLNKSDYFERHPCAPIEQTWRGKTILLKCKTEDEAKATYKLLDDEVRLMFEYAFEHEGEWNTAKENHLYSIGFYGIPEFVEAGSLGEVEQFIKYNKRDV